MPMFFSDFDFGSFGQERGSIAGPADGATNNAELEALAALTGGGYVLAYEISGITYLQVFDEFGVQIGEEVTLSANASNDLEIIGTPNGGFLVVYQDSIVSSAGSENLVTAQFFDGFGATTSDPFTVHSSDQQLRQVDATLLENGDMVIVWNGQSRPDSIQARILTPQGDARTEVFTLSQGEAVNGYFFPNVDTLPGGGFVASWASNGDIFAQAFDDLGVPVGEIVSPQPEQSFIQSRYQSVVGLPDGNFMMVWDDNYSGFEPSRVMAAIYDADGNVVVPIFRVDSSNEFDIIQPEAELLGDGTVLISWRYNVPGEGPNFFQIGEIRAQRVSADGQLLGEEFQVDDGSDLGQHRPLIAAFGTDDFVVAWNNFVDDAPDNIQIRNFYSATEGTSGDDVFQDTSEIDFFAGLAGNDTLIVSSDFSNHTPTTTTPSVGADLGAGDDLVRFEGFPRSVVVAAEGGEGTDTIEIASFNLQINGAELTGFEVLSLLAGGALSNFNGLQQITATGPSSPRTLTDSDNPDAVVTLDQASIGFVRSTVASITGSAGRDAVDVGDGSFVGDVDLGAGIDAVQINAGSLVSTAFSSLDGGEGDEDILIYSFPAGAIVDSLANVTGFERLGIAGGVSGEVTSVELSDLSGFDALLASSTIFQGEITAQAITLSLGASGDMTGTIIAGAPGGSFTLTEGVTVDSYVFYVPWAPVAPSEERDALLSTTINNHGEILNEVDLGRGDDVYDGREGVVGGPVMGNAGNDTLLGGVGAESFFGGLDADILNGGLGDDALDGGSNVDTAVVSGNRADYTVTQTSLGVFEVVGPDGTDTLTAVEFLQFDDETIRLLPGTGVAVTFETADPSVYQDAMNAILDFDGNALGGNGSWLRIGSADVNGDGDIDQILVNDAIGRFATVGTADDGLIYFNDNSWAGETRVAGIYLDPLVISGEVVQGSDQDSQRRFQNDLEIENINRVLGADDYDGDGLQEVYFALTDGTAYLRAIMEADGNIRYANYQSEQEVIDYLTANGFDESTFGDWFTPPTGQAEDGTTTFVNEVQSDKQASEEEAEPSPTDLIGAMLEAKALAGVDLEHAPFAPLTQEGLSPTIDPLGVEFFG